MARAFDSQSKGRGFDSPHLHKTVRVTRVTRVTRKAARPCGSNYKQKTMKTITKLSLVLLLTALSLNCWSQIGVTSYSIYSLGINTSQNRPLSGELKVFANRSIDDILMEADLFYNFKARPYHRFSVGVGLKAGLFRDYDLVDAITVPVQLEIFPLQEFKRLSLVFELAPEFIIDFDPNLRSLWGIRYTFGKN